MYDKKLHMYYVKKITEFKNEGLRFVRREGSVFTRVIVGLLSKTFAAPKITEVVGDEPRVFGSSLAILMNAVPGTAKTLLARALPKLTDLKTARTQFTIDTQPADVLGTQVFDRRKNDFVPKEGPINTNIYLADEITRASEKTISALLEPIEGQFSPVGIRTESIFLEEPWLLLATQNPLEQRGVFQLPEAMKDRFGMEVTMRDADQDMLVDIGKTVDGFDEMITEECITRKEIQEIREFIHKNVYIDDRVWYYIADICTALRYKDPVLSKYIYELEKQLDEECLLHSDNQYRRAIIFMAAAIKVMAFLRGRNYVTFQDVDKLIVDMLGVRMTFGPRINIRGLFGIKVEHLDFVPRGQIGDEKVYLIEPVGVKPIMNSRELTKQIIIRAVLGAQNKK